MTNFTTSQLEAWAGLGPWEWSENWLYVADYNKHPGPVLWYTANDDGVHAKPDDAALIASAPALAAALLAERKAREAEVGELRAALSKIEAMDYINQLSGNMNFERAQEIARAVLAKMEESK